jgi:hypothetical protein
LTTTDIDGEGGGLSGSNVETTSNSDFWVELQSTLSAIIAEHTQELVDGYFSELNPIFAIIKECEEGLDVNSLLEGPLCHSGFKRLN